MRPAKEARGGIESLPPAPVVVLCRSQMGENIGAAARAMLNFGLHELRLAAPACGWPNAKAVAAASGAVAVLNELQTFTDAREAVGDLHHVFATTARARDLSKPVLDPAEAAAEAKRLIASGRRVGVLFGAERTGLENDELLLADAYVTFSANPAFPSLNLGQAVLLFGNSWWQAAAPPREDAPGETVTPATKVEVQGLIDHLVRELDAVDFFRGTARRGSLVDTISLLFERRALTTPEVHLLRGIIKDLTGGRRARRPGSGQDGA
ncbi:MAG: TrmH family RNA methyltransferase [Geminicoccaceae bacterium]